jgi:hypothetical protein
VGEGVGEGASGGGSPAGLNDDDASNSMAILNEERL